MLPLEEKVDPKHAALLVVDVQNDYCHSQGSLARRGLDMSFIQRMVPTLARFIDTARREQVNIIFIRTVYNQWVDAPSWHEWRSRALEIERFPICLEGSWGGEFYEVSPKPEECIVNKHRYSAFVDTDLETILRSKGFKTLIMTGVATNVCVESTARDGFMKDYHIVFLEDCTAANSLDAHEATLKNMVNYFGVVTTSEEVIKAWARLREKALVR